jgi:hypothetical protein
MTYFFNLIGDHLPHRMGIHLPSNLTKVAVYQRLVDDMRARHKPSIISQSQFFRIWDEKFGNVSIPKVCLSHVD